MRFFVHKRRSAPAVIIVALIDVLIVLVIFLLVTTTFKQQATLKLSLPESSQAKKTGANENPPLVVNVNADGLYSFADNVTKTMDQVHSELLAKAAENPQLVLIATGSEVWPTLDAAKLLTADGIKVRVVSLPSWKIFEEQSAAYKASVLPGGVPRIAIEAGATQGWWKYVGLDGDVIGLDRFGASAPGPIVMKELGFSPENIAARAKKLLK